MLSSNEAASSPSTSKLNGVVAAILASLFGLVLALVALELVCRFILVPGKSTSWNDRPSFYFKDPAARTIQDFSYSKEKPEGTYRIAVIGDSFTFATQMQFTDSFPKVLERMLNLNESNRSVEVINFGVPGYSTTHEVGAFKHIKKYQPDMILLQITLNDPQLKPYTPTGITGQNEFGKLDTSKVSGLARHWKTYGFIQSRIHNTRTHYHYKNYYHQLFAENSKTYKNFKESLRLLGKKSKKQNIKLAAVVFPLLGLPLDGTYPFTDIHEKIAQDLDQFNISHFDLFDSYRGAPLARIQLIPGIDFHPNEIAHRIAAEKIYDWLADDSLIPSEIRLAQKFRNRLNIIPDKNGPLP